MNIMSHGRILAILHTLQEHLNNNPTEFEQLLDKIEETI